MFRQKLDSKRTYCRHQSQFLKTQLSACGPRARKSVLASLALSLTSQSAESSNCVQICVCVFAELFSFKKTKIRIFSSNRVLTTFPSESAS